VLRTTLFQHFVTRIGIVPPPAQSASWPCRGGPPFYVKKICKIFAKNTRKKKKKNVSKEATSKECNVIQKI